MGYFQVQQIGMNFSAYQRGRAIILQYSWSVLVFSAYFVYVGLQTSGSRTLPYGLGQLGLVLLLCVALYQGSKLSKWVLVVLMSLFGLLFLAYLKFDNLLGTFIVSLYIYIYFSFVYHLLFSAELNYYLDVRQKLRWESEE